MDDYFVFVLVVWIWKFLIYKKTNTTRYLHLIFSRIGIYLGTFKPSLMF